MSEREIGRDRFDGLRCPKIGCKTIIRGWTGLDELMKLRKHLARKHREVIYLGEALERRASSEKTGKDS